MSLNAENACILSYSGGKDSTLALYHVLQQARAVGLIVMLEEHGLRSRSHAMDTDVIAFQAQALGLPVISAAASWADYEQRFANALQTGRQLGANTLVTGDLDVPEHQSWHQKMAEQAGLQLCMPLQTRTRMQVVNEFIALGFQAVVVTVNLALGMRPEDLGRAFDAALVQDLLARGIDPCGEGGEFHTTVLDGPIFKTAVPVTHGEVQQHEEYAFLPLTLRHDATPF